MTDALSSALIIELLKYAGPAAVVFILVLVGAVMMVRHWIAAMARKQDADRCEHMAKWDTLVAAHKEERERQFKLFERMAETQELHAGILGRLTVLVETNQYCPIRRGDAK
jgi:hypothetical protein